MRTHRRLVFSPARRLRKPGKHLAALAEWAAAFEGAFPEDGDPICEHWHLPVDRRLVDPPWANRADQVRALQLLLDAAAALARARPARLAHQRVYALLFWPEPSASEIGVFVDPAYGADFERRDHPSQRWTPLDPAGRSLARELGLAVPDGFSEAGYRERCEEADEEAPGGTSVFEREVWMVREPPAG